MQAFTKTCELETEKPLLIVPSGDLGDVRGFLFEFSTFVTGKQEDGWSDGKPAGSSPHNQVSLLSMPG